jgi:basic membrane protein A
MNSKKRFGWFVVTGLIIFSMLLTACGGGTTEAPEPVQPTEVPPEPTEVPPEPTEVPPEPTEEPDDGILRIAFLYDGKVDDEGWNAMHDRARLAIEAAYGDLVETQAVERVPWTPAAAQTIEPLIAEGIDVFVDSGLFYGLVTRVVEENPEVKWITIGVPEHDNVSFYYAETSYTTFLLGMAAGLVTETNQLGWMCGYGTDDEWIDANAFHYGARSVNPDVTTYAACIQAYYNPAGARATASRLIESGVDVLYGYVGSPAYNQIAGEQGVWSIGLYEDLSEYGGDTYLGTFGMDFDDLLVEEIGMILDGTWEGGRFNVPFFPDATDIGAWGPNVPADVIEQVEAMRSKIIDEMYWPFVGPAVDVDGNEVYAEGEDISYDEAMGYWPWLLEGIEWFE